MASDARMQVEQKEWEQLASSVPSRMSVQIGQMHKAGTSPTARR
jgi:hypothetical protein